MNQHPVKRITRRALLAGGATAVVGAVATGLMLRNGRQDVAPLAQQFMRPDELEAANDLFRRGDYAAARTAYLSLAASGRIPSSESAHSAALCSLQLGDAAQAFRILSGLATPSSDDLRLITLASARCGKVDQAVGAFDQIPTDEPAFDVELCEAIALASAREGDRYKPISWRFYRAVERADPDSPSIQRLTDSGHFGFTHDFFGYDQHSLLNYARGAKDGAINWGSDTLKGLWRLCRHPVDSVSSFASAVAQIFSSENLKLLLSPTILGSKLGAVAARVYWSAWDSCKNSAARECSLDVNDFGDQRRIHEIAAGRMVGYVAPDLILLILSSGAGAAVKVSDAERVIGVATAMARAEEGIAKANLIGRSAEFLEDAAKLPVLRKLAWLEEPTWELIKNSPRLSNRLEAVANWMGDIRHVPGAKALVECMAGRLHLADEGYLFQLERAAEYARDDKLAAVDREFYVDIALPDKPIRRMWAEADLDLKDGTLVEVKFRSAPLTLDEKLHTQLQKYNRAVAEGQFKRIRLECNNAVTKAVRDRCALLPSPSEISENIKSRAG